jgi:hypothetical protein
VRDDSDPKEFEMTATRSDRVRQFTVTVSGITCVVGTLVGIGVLGTRVEDSAGGSLSADATLLAPASTAFTIWSAIYAGLAAFTVWQWLPRAATSRRIRSVGWLAAASMLLNAAWLLVVQQGWLWASVGVIVALLAVLAVLVKRLSAEQAGSTAEKVVVDGTFGLYLGWVCVATAANIAATIAAEGIRPVRAVSEGIAVLVLLLVGAVGVMLAVVLGGRIAVTAAIVWGLAWIAVGRTTASPDSTTTAITAGAVAVLIVAATAAARLRGRPRPAAGDASYPGPRSWVRRRRA